jgi:hypothetical protein
MGTTLGRTLRNPRKNSTHAARSLVDRSTIQRPAGPFNFDADQPDAFKDRIRIRPGQGTFS